MTGSPCHFSCLCCSGTCTCGTRRRRSAAGIAGRVWQQAQHWRCGPMLGYLRRAAERPTPSDPAAAGLWHPACAPARPLSTHLALIRGAQLHGVVLQHGVLAAWARLIHCGAHLWVRGGRHEAGMRQAFRRMVHKEGAPRATPSEQAAACHCSIPRGEPSMQAAGMATGPLPSPCSSAAPQTPAAPWT